MGEQSATVQTADGKTWTVNVPDHGSDATFTVTFQNVDASTFAQLLALAMARGVDVSGVTR